MYYYQVAPNQIIRSGKDVFTYHSKQSLEMGHIVVVPVGKKEVVGIVINLVTRPEFATKAITRLVEDTPVPSHLIQLSQWMSSYYATPLATVLQTVMPRGVTKKRRIGQRQNKQHSRKRTKIVLNKDQTEAIRRIEKSSSGSLVLHGITGSGKTAIYIESAKRALARNQSVIILVPEIALTSQLVAEFSHHFENILLTHSRQTEAERHQVWRQALHSGIPRVAIGPRSALFLPLKNLKLVVIDECHEPSFQQEQSPRYSALRASAKLAELTSGKTILGSATPLVSDYFLAIKAKRPIIELTKLADTKAVKPHVDLIDMTKRIHFSRHRFFSNQLLSQLETTLQAGKQALIFHNRRGSASTTLCENCGWQAGCPRCFIPLTLHADTHQIRCHICGLSNHVPTSCPECSQANVIHKGIGTKLIESELRKLFPDKNIARFDGDSLRSESVEARYQELYDGVIDIIIGTQVVAKGLDLPQLRTVGVVQADAGLSLPDFQAPERTFQLLSQVIGRVGRTHHPTNVTIQSYQPNHPAVIDGLSQNYQEFYDRTIALRRRTVFPPFCFLLQLTCVYKTEKTAIKNAQALADLLRTKVTVDVEILGPTPAFYERLRDTYRWQLVIKSQQRHNLLEILKYIPRQHWQFELDPITLL